MLAEAFLAGWISVTGYVLPGTTADGSPVGRGVAACPSVFPFGTVLDVERVGLVTCHDRTRDDLWVVDCWVPTVQEAYALTCTRECARRYTVVVTSGNGG